MRRALELAGKGTGFTSPNPLVGAVIVKNGRIIGQGYHKAYGEDHAEIDALEHAAEDVEGASMYVTLEPCSHHGNTPPCTQAIIQSGIVRVVISMVDPNPLVSGSGIAALRSQGIEVITGICEAESRKLNEMFVKFITTGLPLCIMKTAMTLDGKIAAYTGDSRWITNQSSRSRVHALRHHISAILVGVNTVITDDPLLTARTSGYSRNPVRVIADSTGRTPLNSRILTTADQVPTLIAVTQKASSERKLAFEAAGAEVLNLPSRNGRISLQSLVTELGKRKLDSLLIEGGSELCFSALEEGVVDKIQCYIAPKLIGGSTAKTPIGGRGFPLLQQAVAVRDMQVHRIDDDICIEGYISKEVSSCSPV